MICRNKNTFEQKKRVEDVKEYYWHLAIYILVNLFLSGAQFVDGITENKSFIDIFSDFGMYAVWIIWGIGLVFHTWSVFGFIFLFEKDWEARKIRKYMND
ncbi:2TM domain-containing protein [Polaribacter irgensii]|uniref:2TM domain-containing protein n=1 Tax=Polaribacter irgensii TaxID=531 RepID=UPI0012DFD84C